MSDTKLVKVDNWGIHFLQRLKYFFNRTDYCDLTLQFQDNAQLKVHRLVLNACTEYFELLERTCEMYEDCLVMPDDLQADVVVPIVNFMYTGQLEFRQESLERLFQTSQIMNIPVLTKLLDAQRQATIKRPRPSIPISTSNSPQIRNVKQNYPAPSKRSYHKAFENHVEPSENLKKKVTYIPPLKPGKTFPQGQQQTIPQTQQKRTRAPLNYLSVGTPISLIKSHSTYKKPRLTEPKPTRYEVPEEIDPDTVTCDSFTSISYDSRPLMIHPEAKPETRPEKRADFGIFSDPTSSFSAESSGMDVECRRIDNDDYFDEQSVQTPPEAFERKNANNLFDQVVLDSNEGPKVTVEAQDPKQAANIDHAKIISEVLKKYPHLVNSNKNIKLKILDTQSKPDRKATPKKRVEVYPIKKEYEEDKTELEAYETEVLDSKQAAKLIAMGAENIKGPWICLICGTPGKAINFSSYFKFRRHLVEVHNEKPIPNLCEYCGYRSNKRNYLLHHMYTMHDVPPPRPYHFPKCNQCTYIALTSTALVKHKATHADTRTFRCNVCFDLFKTSTHLLKHIQVTGHKYSSERKNENQCIYCLKIFTRETNLLIHLKAQHKREAISDGIMDDSEEDEEEQEQVLPIKYEPSSFEQDEPKEVKYQIRERPDGEIRLTPAKQRILNTGFKPSAQQKVYSYKNVPEFLDQNVQELSPNDSSTNEDMIINEQVNQPCSDTIESEEYATPDDNNELPPVSATSIFTEPINDINTAQAKVTKIASKVNNQPIEIVQLANEEQLIGPNHSVIYDSDGNPSKTLAVLTTLDSSNTNEMMILPDGYQMNVSHAVDTKNNFVVVYSHSVDSNGKSQYIVNSQYGQPQMITTQMGQTLVPQIVQSPAVITQNYTIANSTEPVTNAQVAIVPQIDQTSYQAPFQPQQDIPDTNTILISTEPSVNNISPNNNEIQPTMSEMNQIQIMNSEAPASLQPNINEMDQIQIMDQQDMDTSEQQEDINSLEQQEDMNSLEQQEDMNSLEQQENMNSLEQQGDMDTSEQQGDMDTSEQQEDINTSDQHRDIDTSEQHVTNMQTVDPNSESSVALSSNLDHITVTTIPSKIEENEVSEPLNIIQDETEETENECIEAEVEESEEIINNLNETEDPAPGEIVPEENIIESEQMSPTYTQPDVDLECEAINKVESSQEDSNILPESNIEHIRKIEKTVALDWTEEEEDISQGKELTSEMIPEEHISEKVTVGMSEVEESIENIQQEINQIKADSAVVETYKTEETKEENCNKQEETINDSLSAVPSNGNAEIPPEKLSNLLSDWEETDPQETLDSSTKNSAEAETSESLTVDKTVDNIKNLVNDWEEEDEEKT